MCEHRPENYDPTGGDREQGGPVALTRCRLCGADLPKSESAVAFNAVVAEFRLAEQVQEGRDLECGPCQSWVIRHLRLVTVLAAAWVVSVLVLAVIL